MSQQDGNRVRLIPSTLNRWDGTVTADHHPAPARSAAEQVQWPRIRRPETPPDNTRSER